MILFSNSTSAQNVRTSHPLDNPKIEKYIEQHTKTMGFEEIVWECIDITNKTLYFSTNSKFKSNSQLAIGKRIPTHCVYFNQVYVSMINYAFKINNIRADVYHCVGPVIIGKIDFTKTVSGFFRKLGMTKAANFTKDHDYTMIVHNNDTILVDPIFRTVR